MDNKRKKQLQWLRWQQWLISFIVFLLIVFVFLIIIDKKFSKRIERRPFEGEVKTYDGSLQRNLSNPLGSE
ncbi:MAG: hypothetical protein PHO30_03525 [Candidatus Omnitrophica bacterium]|nr:hypothetical protein [Candidatus Omnitrophota bacterium]